MRAGRAGTYRAPRDGSVEGETNPSDGESDELQSDRQKSAEGEEDDNDEESIFPLVVDPAPTGEADPVGRAAQSMLGYNG